ncbi:MAG TPA: hypothetical protein VGA56_21670 [Opitutaceae bacterium]
MRAPTIFDSALGALHARRVILRRRSFLTLLLLAVAWPVSNSRAEVEIIRLWTGYKETSAFMRLREFVTGKPAKAGPNVLRTDPEERTGFYYTVRLADRDAGSLPAGEVLLQVVPPDGVIPVDYRFPFAGSKRREVRLDIGLTGDDWTHGKVLPLAWRLVIRDASGRTLASRQSFLWTDHAGKTTSG